MNLTSPDLNSLGPVKASRRQSLAPCELRFQENLEKLRELKGKVKDPREVFYAAGQIAKADYWFFLKFICGYKFMDPWDHGEELVWFIGKNRGKPKMILLPREGAKTGLVTIPYVPFLLATDPTLRSILTNVREPKAKLFARQAAAIIELPMYQKCFVNERFEPYVTPSKVWGNDGYNIESRSIQGETIGGRVDPTLKGLGVEGNITGAHVRAMLHDDLINEDTVKSVAEMSKAEAFFRESLICVDPGGELILCCTRWRYNDFYGKIQRGEIQSKSGPFEVLLRGAERVVLNDEGEHVVEIFNPYRTYIDMNGHIQHVGYTKEALAAMKITHGVNYFALFQNQPLSHEAHDFNLDQIREFVEPPRNIVYGAAPRVGMEVDTGGELLYQNFIEMARDTGKAIAVEKLRAPKNKDKHTKIRLVLQPVIEAGRLYIREDLWRKEGSLGQEIREFDKGDDDALDALTYCIERAPKHKLGSPVQPYIAVDFAYTATKQSNHTAIICGYWYGDDFYVVECDKFKAQKIDFKVGRVIRMWEKYAAAKTSSKPSSSTFVRTMGGPNNSYVRRQRSRFQDIDWGQGRYEKKEEDNG